jgi:predicted transcriptional regulator
MTTSRITISISPELNEAIRSIALLAKESVSSIVAQAIAQRVREAAIDDFLGARQRKVR